MKHIPSELAPEKPSFYLRGDVFFVLAMLAYMGMSHAGFPPIAAFMGATVTLLPYLFMKARYGKSLKNYEAMVIHWQISNTRIHIQKLKKEVADGVPKYESEDAKEWESKMNRRIEKSEKAILDLEKLL